MLTKSLISAPLAVSSSCDLEKKIKLQDQRSSSAVPSPESVQKVRIYQNLYYLAKIVGLTGKLHDRESNIFYGFSFNRHGHFSIDPSHSLYIPT